MKMSQMAALNLYLAYVGVISIQMLYKPPEGHAFRKHEAPTSGFMSLTG